MQNMATAMAKNVLLRVHHIRISYKTTSLLIIAAVLASHLTVQLTMLYNFGDPFIVQEPLKSLDGLNGTDLFLFWTGPTKLPTMYEVALWTTVKAYGRENVTIVSQTLSDVKDWYPVVQDLSLYDIAGYLTDIHPYPVWRKFLKRIHGGNIKPHQADFFRIAVVYLFGGFYADFDSLWIRPVPVKLPNERNLSMFRVKRDNIYDIFSNGVLGSAPKQSFHRLVLEKMVVDYHASNWMGIGSLLLDSVNNERNQSFTKLFESVTEPEMYGIQWTEAVAFFYFPLQHNKSQEIGRYVNTTDLSEEEQADKMVEHILHASYQLHMYGAVTKITQGLVPVKDSLYDRILRKLEINVSDFQ